MPPANWDVERALDEVILAIRTGAVTLAMDPATEAGLRSGYRPDFEAQRTKGIEWTDVRAKILALALVVGGMAAFLTTIKSAMASGSLATTLDEQLTYAAALLVARSSPECASLHFGGFCRNFPGAKALTPSDLDALVRASGFLGPLVGLSLRG